MSLQNIGDHWQRFPHQQTNVVHERHGRGAGAAVTAVYRNKIRGNFFAAPVDLCAKSNQTPIGAHNGFEANRLARHFADMGDEIENLGDRVYFGMPVWRY